MGGMIMKETLKKTLAYVIALNLAVSSISVPNTAVKAEENKAVASETVSTEGYSEPTVVEEVVSDRTADSITVLLSNGMKQTTYYSDDIYYQNAEGNMQSMIMS